MRDLNSVIITGRVGQDIELKTTGTGKSVCNLSLAVQNDSQTNWIRCVAWEKTAEALSKFAHKGDRITIKGRIQTREWEQNGQKRNTSEVWVEWIQFLNQKEYAKRDADDDYKSMITEDEALDNEELPF